jgi:predicted membrane protein
MRPVRLWIGLVLLTLGVFGVLDATGALSAGSTIDRWWPLAIVGLGLMAMLAQQHISFWPSVITVLGVILLADTQNWATGDLVGPAILILIGGAVLAGFVRHRTAAHLEQREPIAVFSGAKMVDRSEHLNHTDVTAIFGGATLDLRDAHIDEVATVDAFAMFGGVQVLVPKDWRVSVGGLPIFGGYEDKTIGNGSLLVDAPLLKVNATAIFGGVEVANEPKQ